MKTSRLCVQQQYRTAAEKQQQLGTVVSVTHDDLVDSQPVIGFAQLLGGICMIICNCLKLVQRDSLVVDVLTPCDLIRDEQ